MRCGVQSVSDEQSFELAYARYHGQIRGYLLQQLEDLALADDLMQEVFIRAWERWQLFDGRWLLAWLNRIAKNLLIDYVRMQQSRLQLSLDVAISSDDDHEWSSRLAAPAVLEPEMIILDREQYEHLYAALRNLTPKYRIIVIALSGYGISSAVLARRLGITQMAVKAIAVRAREELHQALSGKRRPSRWRGIWIAHELICQQCGCTFEALCRPRAKSIPRRHCSSTCRNRWAKAREKSRDLERKHNAGRADIRQWSDPCAA